MLYRLKWHSGALSEYRHLSPGLKQLIIEELEILLDDPMPPYAKEMDREWSGCWRIRIDGWRLVYRIDENEKIILILRIKIRNRNTYI